MIRKSLRRYALVMLLAFALLIAALLLSGLIGALLAFVAAALALGALLAMIREDMRYGRDKGVGGEDAPNEHR